MKKKLKSLWPVMSRALFASLILFMRGLGRRISVRGHTTNQSSATEPSERESNPGTEKSSLPLHDRAKCAQGKTSALPSLASARSRRSAGPCCPANDRHHQCRSEGLNPLRLSVLRQVLRWCQSAVRNNRSDEYFFRKRLEGFSRLALDVYRAAPIVSVVPCDCASENSLANV
jgi:hypothetical protein